MLEQHPPFCHFRTATLLDPIMQKYPLVVFFGHHKCGSRFMRNQIMQKFADDNAYDVVAYSIDNPPFHFRTSHDLDLYNVDFESLAKTSPAVLTLSNSGKPVVDAINALDCDYRGVHVIRDLRQVLVSDYFHHLDGHSLSSPAGWVWDQLVEDRPRLQELNLEQGLLYELDHITADVIDNQILPWRSDPRILELKLESFADGLSSNVRAIGRHCRFGRLPVIDQAETHRNPNSRHWSKVLTRNVKDAIKARYGDWLIEHRYASDNNW